MQLFDLHCDTLYECIKTHQSILQNTYHIDLQKGSIFTPWYQCFAAWVPDTFSPLKANALIQSMFEKANAFEIQYPWAFHVLRDGQEFYYPPQTSLTAVLTIENGGAAAPDGILPLYWIQNAVKAITITWNGDNYWASGCMGDTRRGLTPQGVIAVREMELHGIIPDAAHLNRRGFYELADTVTKPFMVSHTASAACFSSKRNLSDNQFLLMCKNAGLVGIDLCEQHVGTPLMDAFVEHLEHFLSLGGEHTVAVGGDLDGITLPSPYADISIYQTLYERLLQRNYAESLVEDIFFNNAYRFFEKYM